MKMNNVNPTNELEKNTSVFSIDENAIEKIIHITSNDNKMLLINNRYYCEFTSSPTSRDVVPDYHFFSDLKKEDNSPTFVRYANCFVLDVYVGKGHHTHQYGKIYYFKHLDLKNTNTFSIMLNDDKALINVVSLEIIDKPYPIHNLIDLIDDDLLPKHLTSNDGDPMMSLDGVSSIDFGKYGNKSVNMEYYINGKLYFEIVDFTDIPEGGIVQLNDTTRREVIVNMHATGDRLSNFNVATIATLINAKLKALK